MHPFASRSLSLLFLATALAGCPSSSSGTDAGVSDTGSAPDTGSTPDTGPHDAGALDDAIIDASGGGGDAGCASTPTFADVQTMMFVPTCGGPLNCHSASSRLTGGGLLLDDAAAYDALVGAAASIDPTLTRVVAGDPASSLLYRKLINDLPADGSLGSPMPNGEGIMWHELPADQIDLVRCWIAGGAPR